MEYTLMHKNIPVVDIVMDGGDMIGIGEVYNIAHIPVGIEQYAQKPVRASLNRWWQDRGIPVSRSGLREGLELLGVSHQKELLDKSYGLSLSDQYWINPKNAPLDWKTVNFFENEFSDDVGNALFGEHPEGAIDYISPCSASDGWLKKKWKIVHGRRCLIKSGSGTILQEPYNEVIAASMHRRLGIAPYVKYEIIMEKGLPYSVCEDFITSDTELVSGAQILRSQKKRNDVSYYDHLVSMCRQYGISGVESFLDYMITTDFMIANTDRHFDNFGFIRNAETLEFEGPAPIFDSGTSLWFDVPERRIDLKEEVKAKPFKKTQMEQIKLVQRFDWLEIQKLRGLDEEANEIFAGADTITPERRSILCLGIKENIQTLEQIVTACERQRHFFIHDNKNWNSSDGPSS